MGLLHLPTGIVFAMFWGARAAAAQDDGTAPLRRFAVAGTIGSHVNGEGDVKAAAFGVALTERVTLLANVERNHQPGRNWSYPNNSYSFNRGGTITSLSGEVRQVVWRDTHLEPFWLAGGGVARVDPDVNDLFPDPAPSATEQIAYVGGGALFPVHPALAFSVDVKLLIELKANAEMGAMFPLRVGATWRF
jgi:hypothetical protein